MNNDYKRSIVLPEAESKTDSTGPASVWLVEDNVDLRDAVQRVIDFEKTMQCTHVFSDCESVIETIETGCLPDLILMDLGLPGMGGLKGIQEIKTLEPEIEIVVLTVFDHKEKVFDALCWGATGYLLKGTPLIEIPDAIKMVLAGGAPINPRIARSALSFFSSKSVKAQTEDYRLAKREIEVLEGMAAGRIKKQIAYDMEISFHTIDEYFRRIYKKLHVNTMPEAVAKAIREGLVD